MIPQEKAKELVANYYQEFIKDYQVLSCLSDEIKHSIYNKRTTFAKKCALIAVDEILEMDLPILEEDADKFYDYWNEVKQEIKKL